MVIARVIGDVVGAQKAVRKAVIVQPLELDGTNRGRAVVAQIGAEAGVGAVVLLARESAGDVAVIGVVDRVELFAAAAGAEHK